MVEGLKLPLLTSLLLKDNSGVKILTGQKKFLSPSDVRAWQIAHVCGDAGVTKPTVLPAV